MRGCAACGAHHGSARTALYRGAGFVLRCPSCGDVALRVVPADERRILTFHGTWSVELSA